jgi:hypothetical protein
VKYSALRNQVAALRALLPVGLTIRITGGLPPDHSAQPATPPGGDLKAQAALFRRATTPPPAPGAGEPEPPAAAREARRV